MLLDYQLPERQTTASEAEVIGLIQVGDEYAYRRKGSTASWLVQQNNLDLETEDDSRLQSLP